MSIASLGTMSIVVLFGLCLMTIALAILGSRLQSTRLIEASVRGIYSVASMAAFSSSLIVYAFIADDFSLQYVFSTSEAAMPLFYKITAFWGGLDGSLLFWVLLLSLFSAKAVQVNRERHASLIPHIVAILAGIDLFFIGLLIVLKNPFDPFLLDVPVLGSGLNPLLQNAYMVVHPPCLYLGYVSLAIPFAFGMAALITGQVDDAWQASVRRWTLFSWLFLTLGLILGGLWAYEELGWGGYWAWDPVENAGLLPWFTATAFLHSVMIQERRGMMRAWNLILVIMSFWLSIMGTFLTRSGVVQSVHAFGKDPQLAWAFGGLMALIFVASFGLLIWRLPLLRSRNEFDGVLSREFAFLLNNWMLLVMALFVLGSTIYPTISEWWDERITLRPTHFNHYMVPAGLALLLLTGVGPLLAWRRSTPKSLAYQFRIPLAVGGVGVLIPALLGLDDVWGLTCFSLCAFTGATIVQEFWRGIAVARKGGEIGLVEASIRLLTRARRRYGGYIIHLGVVLMFFGWAGNSYGLEKTVSLRPGERVDLGRYEIEHAGLQATEDWQKEMITANLVVMRDQEHISELTPGRWWYFKLPDQPTTEVSRYMSVAEDVYASMLTADMATGEVQLRLFINPLVNWIWLGTSIMLGGSLICIGTRRRERESEF